MEIIGIIIGVLFLAFIVFVALFYNVLSWGFVVSKFYLWFIISMYPTAPHFTIIQFIGVMFFLSSIMPKHHTKPIKKEYLDEKNEWIGLVLAPWITLLCGWLITLI